MMWRGTKTQLSSVALAVRGLVQRGTGAAQTEQAQMPVARASTSGLYGIKLQAAAASWPKSDRRAGAAAGRVAQRCPTAFSGQLFLRACNL
jgi:hypothetical protein